MRRKRNVWEAQPQVSGGFNGDGVRAGFLLQMLGHAEKLGAKTTFPEGSRKQRNQLSISFCLPPAAPLAPQVRRQTSLGQGQAHANIVHVFCRFCAELLPTFCEPVLPVVACSALFSPPPCTELGKPEGVPGCLSGTAGPKCLSGRFCDLCGHMTGATSPAVHTPCPPCPPPAVRPPPRTLGPCHHW